MQRRFRTLENRNGRAIAGLSMGGYGALKFGIKYPEKFYFAGSLSGALGAASWTESELGGFELIFRSLLPVFGPPDSSSRLANDLCRLYREFPADRVATLPFIYFDCGTEDPLLQSNRVLVDILLTRKIPHEYRQLPGSHNWAYWDAQAQEVLKLVWRKFAHKTQHARPAFQRESRRVDNSKQFATLMSQFLTRARKPTVCFTGVENESIDAIEWRIALV